MSRREIHGWAAITLMLGAFGCGGGGDNGSGTVTSPSPSGGSVTIDIVVTGGAQSFTPNPAAQMQGGTVAWRNSDGALHRIVANDGSFDTGDIAPGATSRAIQAPAAGANYHCSIHPAMIGAIGSVQGEAPPPCSGLYCS